MSEIFETHFASYPVHRRCFVRFLASTASAAFILKDTNKELGGYVRVGATYNITESKGANCHFTSDISQRKYYGEHIFNSDKSAHIAAMRQKRLPGIRIRGSSQAIPDCIGMCAKTRTAERQRILKFTISARITNVRSAD